MKALILAAGEGKRLMPRTNFLPKPLIKIRGRHLLDYWIDNIKQTSIKDIYINTFYLSKKIEDHVINIKNCKISLIKENELKGTAGTLISNIEKFLNDDLLLLHGDNFTLFDLNKLIKFHKRRKNNSLISMLTFKTNNPNECGILEIGKDNLVIRYEEKPNKPFSNLANAAVFILSKKALQLIKDKNKKAHDFSAELIPEFIDRIQAIYTEEFFIDIGNKKNLYLARKFMRNKSL